MVIFEAIHTVLDFIGGVLTFLFVLCCGLVVAAHVFLAWADHDRELEREEQRRRQDAWARRAARPVTPVTVLPAQTARPASPAAEALRNLREAKEKLELENRFLSAQVDAARKALRAVGFDDDGK